MTNWLSPIIQKVKIYYPYKLLSEENNQAQGKVEDPTQDNEDKICNRCNKIPFRRSTCESKENEGHYKLRYQKRNETTKISGLKKVNVPTLQSEKKGREVKNTRKK